MANEQDIRCEVVEADTEAGEIAQIVKDRFREMRRGKLVDALAGVPCTVLRITGDPTIKAIALIGYKTSEVKDISVEIDETTHIVGVSFTSDEADHTKTFRRLSFSINPKTHNAQHFDGSGEGQVDVGLNYNNDGGTCGTLTTISARLASAIQDKFSLPGRFHTEQSIITLFSNEQRHALNAREIATPRVFAFVEGAQPVQPIR